MTLEKIPNKEYCDIIKAQRNKSGYSQVYVAKKLGISQKTYSKIENGHIKLTEVMKCNISEILKLCPSEICQSKEHCQKQLRLENIRLKELLNLHNIDH